MEKRIDPLSFEFLEGDWQLYDAIHGDFQLLMSFDDVSKNFIIARVLLMKSFGMIS